MSTVILRALVWGLALLACGCTTNQQLRGTGFRPPAGTYKLIVMNPDVSVGLLTAGGMVEPREDWTKQARENVVKALTVQQIGRGADVRIAAAATDTGWDVTKVNDLVSLHNAVGSSILVFKYGPVPLPTKQNTFDWTLGKEAVEFGAGTHYDYALFLHAEDSFSSEGRVALQVAGLLACAVGVCVVAPGGQQAAFASLVDLKSGNVVWFNFLRSSAGDIRTSDGAGKMVNALLAGMNSPAETSGRRTHN